MTFLQALWPFSRANADAGGGAAGSPPTSAQADTDAEPHGADTVADGADTVAGGADADAGGVGGSCIGIGTRPIPAGRLVWSTRTQAFEWELPEGFVPATQRDDLEPWFPWDVDEHARELHWALIAWGFGGQTIDYLTLGELYKVLCHRLGWVPGPWITIGAAFRRVTNGRKIYPRLKFNDGISRRPRAYHIPMELPDQKPLVMPGLPGGPPLKQFRVPSFDEARSAA